MKWHIAYLEVFIKSNKKPGRNDMEKQLFNKGDLVRVAEDLGNSMLHFTNDCAAIIEYSYADRYGGDDTSSYAIYTKNDGGIAWYKEGQLTLIEKDRADLLDQWKKENNER